MKFKCEESSIVEDGNSFSQTVINNACCNLNGNFLMVTIKLVDFK